MAAFPGSGHGGALKARAAPAFLAQDQSAEIEMKRPGKSNGRGASRAKARPSARRLDPVIIEIVRNGVIAVTEEMKTNLTRTAYNMIIYEALDFTVGLFTAHGETVSIGIGLPMFIRGMAETVKAKIRHFGKSAIRPGDIYVTKDSYLTGRPL